ncbi:hypothetical protein ACJU26_04295 [Acidithiobacillus sp. M4-SHS-6]|uniref:hypothetical protein n=1 Tax=Acidithiobacillus sp. M4-SHS-6 TaxID=3383024 RepID=UPI0039BE026E
MNPAASPVSREAIARLRAMERLATPGPWEAHPRQDHHAIESPSAQDVIESPTPLVATIPFVDTRARHDAAFIAAMRNVLPDLLDEIERLRVAEEQRHSPLSCTPMRGPVRKAVP